MPTHISHYVRERAPTAKQLLEEGRCHACGRAAVVKHANVDEVGGRTVSECKRCSWTDYDDQEQVHLAGLAGEDDSRWSEE